MLPLALAGALAWCAGAQDPIREERIPVSPPRPRQPLFLLQNRSEPSKDSPPAGLHVDVDDQGRQLLLSNGRLYSVESEDRFELRQHVPGEPWSAFTEALKLRNGVLYKRQKGDILRFEKGGWDVVLHARTFFSNFEVTEGGGLVLFNTGIPPRHTQLRENPAWMDLGGMQPGTANFVEVWAPRARGPYKTIDYPEELRLLNEEWTTGITGCEWTWKVGSRYLMYYREIGQV